MSAEGIGSGVEKLRVVAAETHRGVLHAEPAGPIPCLEALELIPPRDRIEEDEVRDRRIELADRVRQGTAKRRPGEARPFGIAALQEIDRLEMLRLRRLHRADDVELVGDRGAVRHEGREVQAGDIRRRASERAAAGPAGLRIPSLELARGTAQPEKDAALLGAFCLRGKNGIVKQAGKTPHPCGGEPLEEQPTMEPMLVTRAVAGLEVWGRLRHQAHGMVRNSALVNSAQTRSRAASAGCSARAATNGSACAISSGAGARPSTA